MDLRTDTRVQGALVLALALAWSCAPGDPTGLGGPPADSPVGRFGSAGAQLQFPTRLAASPDGAIYVSDVQSGCVLGYRGGRRTTDLCGLDRPLGVALAGNLLYVGLEGRGSVEAFDLSTRTHLRTVAAPGTVAMPNAMAVDPAGTLWVADSRRDTVISFGPDGQPGVTLGGPGSADGLFRFPAGVAADATRVVVADQGNHRVQVFDTAGQWLRSFGRPIPSEAASLDEVRGGFTRVQAVALAGDRIHALDATHGWVQTFDLLGRPLGFAGRKGDCAECMGLGTDLVVGPGGRLLVADPDHRRWVSLDGEVAR